MKRKKIYIVLAILFIALAVGITFVQCGNVGELYTLHEAYNNGWLTEDDIKNIAYYYREDVIDGGLEDEKYLPISKKPEELNFTVKNKIKKAYVHKYDANFFTLQINNYYGTYNNYVVVHMQGLTFTSDILYEDITLGNVTIRSYAPHLIQVWHE